jgi:hypothetical protein
MSFFNQTKEQIAPTLTSVKDGLKLPDLNKTGVFSKRSMSLT